MKNTSRNERISQSQAQAYGMLCLFALFLAGNHIIGRAVHEDIPPIGLSFWRWLAGAVILAPFALQAMRGRGHFLLGHWRALALITGFMMAGTTLILVALGKTSAINVSLINAVQPTLTVLFAWLFFRQPLTVLRTLGVVLGIAGVAVTVTRGDWSVFISLELGAGDLLALLAMCAFAGYALNLWRVPRELGVSVVLFIISSAGAVMLLPLYLWETMTVQTMPISATSIAAILALALLVSVFGNLCWYAGNRVIGPSRASMFVNLIPVFGATLAVIFLNEKLHAYHVAGGVMVIIGLILAVGGGHIEERR